MSYQVTIYSAHERKKYQERMTVPVRAGRWDKWGNLDSHLQKPSTNLLSRKQWIQQVARCIELSMTKAEFFKKVDADFKRKEEKILFFLNENPRLKRSDLVKDKTELPAGDYSWFQYRSPGGYQRGLSHKEMVSVRNLLGW